MAFSNLTSLRYGKAFAKSVRDKENHVKDYMVFFDKLVELFSLPEAKAVLCSKVMPNALKRELIDYALAKVGKAVPSELDNFIRVLIDAGRLSYLPDIITALQDILDEEENMARGELLSAVPLSKEQVSDIGKHLERIFNKKIHLTSQIKPELLGGFVARVGNTLMDLSVRSSLDSLVAKAIE